jgi:peptide/nickel transport system permease protein
MSKITIKSKIKFYSALVLAIIFLGCFANYLVPFDPNAQNLGMALMAPNGAHWLGTDIYGRDMLSRVLMGTRTSVLSTLLLVFLVSFIGTVLGTFSAYKGGFWDNLLMRLADICVAFPGLVFAIALAGILGGGIFTAIGALTVISWPKYARLARGQALIQLSQDFVKAARLDGTHGWLLVWRFVWPNIINTMLVTALLDFGTLLIEITSLSFLGLGAMPPTAEWGAMLSNGRSMIQTSPWTVLAPGVAIFLTVAIFNLWGETLRDYLDTYPTRSEDHV